MDKACVSRYLQEDKKVEINMCTMLKMHDYFIPKVSVRHAPFQREK